MVIDELEPRRLFAQIVQLEYASGRITNELRLYGTPGNDILRVSMQDANRIVVNENGLISYFPASGVDQVVVNYLLARSSPAGAGNDRLEVVNNPAFPFKKLTWMWGGLGNDTLIGGTEQSILEGNDGDDLVMGGGGSDVIGGGTGVNQIFGGDGDDYITNGLGRDLIDGGPGIDTMTADSHVTDSVPHNGDIPFRHTGMTITLDGIANDGGPGENDNILETVENIYGAYDRNVIIGSASNVNNNFFGNQDSDRLDGGGGNDNLYGGTGNDVLIGRAGSDYLDGGANDDYLYGGDGADILRGGIGNDVLSGGTGSDSLFGDAGNDRLFARDGVIDFILDGGTGTDLLDRDPNDPAGTSIELVI